MLKRNGLTVKNKSNILRRILTWHVADAHKPQCGISLGEIAGILTLFSAPLIGLALLLHKLHN